MELSDLKISDLKLLRFSRGLMSVAEKLKHRTLQDDDAHELYHR